MAWVREVIYSQNSSQSLYPQPWSGEMVAGLGTQDSNMQPRLECPSKRPVYPHSQVMIWKQSQRTLPTSVPCWSHPPTPPTAFDLHPTWLGPDWRSPAALPQDWSPAHKVLHLSQLRSDLLPASLWQQEPSEVPRREQRRKVTLG